MNKRDIRKLVRQKRMELPDNWVKEYSENICRQVVTSYEFKQAKTVYLYCEVNNEVSLDVLIHQCKEQDKTMAFPKVEGKDLVFYVANDDDDFDKGEFDIPEPKPIQKADEPDLIIVPGVAFTYEGMRIGYGGGYYDRFLKNHTAHTIGMAYKFQMFEQLPTEDYDIPLDEVVYNI